MVKVMACLALLSLAACGGDSDEPPVIGYERDLEGCSEPAACLKDGTERHKVAGVQLIHKRSAGNPWVAVHVMVDTERADARSAHARAMVMRLIDWYGSAVFQTTWERELASIGATVESRSGLDYASVSLVVPAANIARGFQLLSAAVNHPPSERVTPEWFETFRSGYASTAAVAADDVDGAASLAAWSLFVQGHPYSRDLREIQNVQLSDLEVAANALQVAPMTVTVVGDVSLEGAITRTAGSFARSEFAAGSEEPPEFTPDPDVRVKFVQRADAPATHLYAYFRAPAPSAADYAPLELGVRVLSSRLYDELRTKRGLVYAVGVDVANYRRGYGYTTLSTTELPEAMAAFRETLQQLVSDGIDDAELEGARAQYLTEFYQRTHSVESLSWMLGDWQMTSGDWHLAAQYMERIAEVDPAAAREAVEHYVRELRYGVAGPRKYSEEQVTGTPGPPPDPCEVNPTMCGCPKQISTVEVCNTKDDDCDGKVDEHPGVTEWCNGLDDDCDGIVDNVAVTEWCNGQDDDCDGKVDEAGMAETCNELDDDCDGKVDEDTVSLETCNGLDDDCDRKVDESDGRCVCPQPEWCDDLDNDCDGKVDEELPQKQLCGVCPANYTWQNCPGHTMFASSISFSAALGGVAGADAKCQQLAATAGRTGTWRAFIADANVGADERLQVTRPVYNMRHELVAVDKRNLFSGPLMNAVDATENGTMVVPAPWAWFGGFEFSCGSWTQADENGLADVIVFMHGGTNFFRFLCSETAHLYCIDQDL